MGGREEQWECPREKHFLLHHFPASVSPRSQSRNHQFDFLFFFVSSKGLNTELAGLHGLLGVMLPSK